MHKPQANDRRERYREPAPVQDKAEQPTRKTTRKRAAKKTSK